MTEPAAPTTSARPTSNGLRAGLRRLSTFLLVYGIVGLTIAALGLVAVAWAGGRVTTLAERVESEVAVLAETIDASAMALDDAGSTALSFAVTLERTPPTVRQAAATVDRVREAFLDIEARLAGVSVLGSRPLATTAERFGAIAADLAGLDTRLELIATDLEGNRDALLANARSLDALAGRLSDQAARLRSGVVGESIDDIGTLIQVMLVLFTAWTAVPAVGAIGLGIWLRREVDPD